MADVKKTSNLAIGNAILDLVDDEARDLIAGIESNVDDTVAQLEARVDNLITTYEANGGTKRTETVLFSSDTPSQGNVQNDRGYFDLEDGIDEYDYIEVYYSAFNKHNLIRIKPDDVPVAGTTNPNPVTWSSESIPDVSSENHALVRTATFVLYKFDDVDRVSFDFWVRGWNGSAASDCDFGDSTTAAFKIGILKIVGIKYETASSIKDPELADIRTGADGVAYDSAGDAVREQISNLNEDLRNYNSYDLLRKFATYTNRTSGGITYTWNSDKTICTAVGTTTGLSVTNLYNVSNSMPAGMVAGEKYYVKCHTTDTKLMLEIIAYNGSTNIKDVLITDDTEIIVPSNTTTLIIRIRTRHITGSPSTVNATISVQILNAKTNEELSIQSNANTEKANYAVDTLESFNVYDLLHKFGSFNNATSGGITYAWSADKLVCTAVGTTTGLSVNTLYSGDGLPTGITAGETYYIKCKTTDPNLLLEIIAYNGSTNIKDVLITEDTSYKVPLDTTTLVIRVRTRHTTGSPSTVNATISVQILNAPTTQKLAHDIEQPQMGYMQIFPKYTTIGDSLMGGYMKRNGVTINTATAKEAGNNWVNYLALRIGRIFTNLAVGNTTTEDWRTNYISGANIDTNAYIVGLGVNDHRQSVIIGTASDIATNFEDNANSFYGNYDYILRQLHAWMPTAHIFCFTIPTVEGGTSEDYNVAIRSVCALYPTYVHCIDLARDYSKLYDNPIVTDNYTGGHFNPVAYSYMSMAIEKAINNFMNSHNSLFATAPYA